MNLSRAARSTLVQPRVTLRPPRLLHRTLTDYTAKYAEKLQKRAQEEGVTLDDLRARLKKEEWEKAKQRLAKAAEAAARSSESSGPSSSSQSSPNSRDSLSAVRRDGSPVKPLSSILNIDRILQTPHTSAQISALWTTFHASRSGGTGRGYICASVPRRVYDNMLTAGQRYSQFVIPVPRAGDAATEADRAYEFFVLQWGFYDAPPIPVPGASDGVPFASGTPAPAPASVEPNPQTATIIFTPLLEYKQRQSFATPYLVLTFYPDLSSSHDVVLMRGEITPTSGSARRDGKSYMLSQQDAQLLALGMQKFYIWADGEKGQVRQQLLKEFHERPADFEWAELLKHGEVDA